ncbi:hypothetical protein M758_7G154500 [Ceratodon purpureus]|nr:hypothetical protein M758_7G154500 [Ceratodon purpureus]
MALAPFFGLRNSVFGMSDPSFEEMANIFDHSPVASYARDAQAMASTNVDWKETPTEHVFMVDMPGLKKEEIKVHVEDGRTLSISGQRSREDVQRTDTWHRVERSSGQFMRRFRLPVDANLDCVAAKVENGVLTVTVPKVESKSQARSIQVGESAGAHPPAVEQNGHNDNVAPATPPGNGAQSQ